MKLCSSVITFFLAIFAGVDACAAPMVVLREISCNNGSLIIKQVGPTQSYGDTITAAFTIKSNGITEHATGIKNNNFFEVKSKTYYVYAGTGGLTFGKNGVPKKIVICTNSKYEQPSPGFRSQ